MGVRGLTTYIANRSHIYLENYELSNSSLVIDGNSLGSQIYRLHCNCNDCFGGDYDKYANVIRNFFKLLGTCNIIPIVILDGGYEQRKLRTTLERLRTKAKNAINLNSVTEGSCSQFPLFLREVFKDVVTELNIKCVRCEFEADGAIACVAKTLGCPVLSYDSDFFIFDALYIPIPTLSLNPDRRYNKQTKEYDYFMRCSIYRVDKFLNSFGGMDKTNLPLLGVLLGNDYMKRRAFVAFYKQLKIQKDRGASNEHQRRIKSVIMWLRHETFESACLKILSRFKSIHRRNLMKRIEEATQAYTHISSDICEFLGITSAMTEESVLTSQLKHITIDEDDSELESSEDADVEHVNSDDSEEDMELGEDTVPVSDKCDVFIPQFFRTKFKMCQYPPGFMDMLTLNYYYCVPQVEDISRSSCHTISLDILAAIHKILRGSMSRPFTYYTRNETCAVKKFCLEAPQVELPSLCDLEHMKAEDKIKIFLQILEIDVSYVAKHVECFPGNWHLLVISLTYWVKHGNVHRAYIFAIVLCAIILLYVDKEIGFCRSSKTFFSRCSKLLEDLAGNGSVKATTFPSSNIHEFITLIDQRDAVLCMKQVIHYFEMDPKLRTNIRLYDKSVVHDLCEFQSCLLHIKYLNCLLDLPFEDLCISSVFNGTFIYNMIVNLQKRSNVDAYLNTFLGGCPKILNLFQSIVANISEGLQDTIYTACVGVKSARRRRHRKKKTLNTDEENNEKLSSGDESDSLHDENNRFTILKSLNK